MNKHESTWILTIFFKVSCILQNNCCWCQVFQEILKGRQEHYVFRRGKWIPRANHTIAINELQSTLKHPLFPDNAYMSESLRDWNLFEGIPSCELRALTLGLFEHIIRAMFFTYKAVLRRTDLVNSNDC